MLWIARISATLVVVMLMMKVVGESGSGPAGVREWVYLTLFPFGFSAGYLLGWRWPRLGGWLSLGCVVLSLIVIGRVFDWQAYLFWGLLSLPGILYVLAEAEPRKLQ
ncbi:MAG TPA: hypothetical protein VLU25_21865 [Acidobacteriota bacterium]|nr:hypothetical protein [Acidobacteriota bacterium]